MSEHQKLMTAQSVPSRGHRKPGPAIDGDGPSDGPIPIRDDRGGRDARLRFPMSAAEEIFALNPPDEPPTMQFELRVSGAFDEAKLRAAIDAALATHPMSRARLVRRRLLIRPPLWQIAESQECDALSVIDCPDDRGLAAIRDAHFSRRVDLAQVPAMLILLVRRPGGDSLLLNIHHCIMDGIGALRWINSVARAYAGRPDPVPAIDPIAVRDLRTQFGGRASVASPTEPAPRALSEAQVALVAGRRDLAVPGYRIEHATLTAEQCAGLDPCRFGSDATFNDLLLAALHLTIAAWNAERDHACELISILVPANLRPLAWNHEVVANLAVVDRNKTSAEDRSTPERLMAAVTGQTRRMRGGNGFARFLGRPRWQCWLIANVILPLILYRPGVVPRRVKGAVDTILFANLGRIERRVSGFGDAGELSEFWISPPVSMPMGIGIDAAILRGRLHLALRSRRALFNDRDAGRFLESFVATITKLGRRGPAASGAESGA